VEFGNDIFTVGLPDIKLSLRESSTLVKADFARPENRFFRSDRLMCFAARTMMT
jgi:hypothetical protein